MGRFLSIFLMLSLSACSASSVTVGEVEDKVIEDINIAINNHDYRLFYMGGRVLNFPGIDNNEINTLISVCGQKIMNNTSDVLKKEEDLKHLELAYQYAKQYNKRMKLHCKKI